MGDAFDRAVEREAKLRRRSRPPIPELMNIALAYQLAVFVVWGAGLLAHHLLWPEPSWLRITHTIVFGAVNAMWFLSAVFGRRMLRRFEDQTAEQPPS